ncbi:MAG: porin family protein [Odoribacter sp.]
MTQIMKQNHLKKGILLTFVCLFTYTLMAQSPINIGIHGGISSTKMRIRDIEQVSKSEGRAGYMIGAFMRVNLGGIYLEPSLNFVHKTSLVKTITEENGRLKINSFDIPLMVGLNVLDLSILKLRAYAGPVMSFPGKIKHSLPVLPDLDSDKVMWNGKIGAGVDVWKLTFDIDYEKGFKKLGHDIKSPRSFNLTLGLKII